MQYLGCRSKYLGAKNRSAARATGPLYWNSQTLFIRPQIGAGIYSVPIASLTSLIMGSIRASFAWQTVETALAYEDA